MHCKSPAPHDYRDAPALLNDTNVQKNACFQGISPPEPYVIKTEQNAEESTISQTESYSCDVNGADDKEHEQSHEHVERSEAPLLAEADSNSEQECLVMTEPLISSSNEKCHEIVDEPTHVPDKPNGLDISGLELLYKSIEHMESLETKRAQKDETVAGEFSSDVSYPELRGLGLLCALAEQRILEETNHKPESSQSIFQEPEVNNSSKPIISDVNRNYRTPQSEKEVRRYLANRKDPSHSNLTAVDMKISPQNELEMNMRNRLAELQRKYKETQRELSRLTPRKNSTEGKLLILQESEQIDFVFMVGSFRVL